MVGGSVQTKRLTGLPEGIIDEWWVGCMHMAQASWQRVKAKLRRRCAVAFARVALQSFANCGSGALFAFSCSISYSYGW